MRIKDSSVELYSRHKSSHRMEIDQSWPLAVDEPNEGNHDLLDISVEARQGQYEIAEQLPLFANESAYLALDSDRNGRISDRSELCGTSGPQGQDQSDALHDQLCLWGQGSKLSNNRLEQDGEGIHGDNLDTPFGMHEALIQQRSSSVYLNTSAPDDLIIQVDLLS